ncbi:Bifunctional inhibitor/plant lipid transfer protein/seed storage helical domain [Macleaya cordata]|uniref:Bifunctional inhibitor/plant lipid transfer protein/seed storage helical domain n=1 Tax=Macleaya cordata TaxID=56857 RepID=A0A200QGD6_MACCD|nr:Bifunctional inhibitor/plant lipid transfer protein/seed storage helical domain [Macleaya cordata]
MMKTTTTSHQFVFLLCLFLVVLCSSFLFEPIFGAGPPSVEDQCTDQFAKVGTCLSYATGKAATPSDECCASVKDIREHKPVCLCYIILETHKGESSLKQMGLQEAKLLQLPNVCKLADTSVSHCPKLLNLSPSSPDNAIFTNSSSPATSTPTSPSSATPSTAKNDTSAGFVNGPPHLVGHTTIVVLVAVFVSLFPTGLIIFV